MAIALSIHAQSLSHSSSGARPKFEVASVKPCAPNTVTGTLSATIGPITANYNCQTLLDYVRSAYTGLATGRFTGPTRIEGSPQWVNRDLYRITAKSGFPMRGTAETAMLQTLLEDRFRLKVHRETRAAPVYALIATKAGVRLPAAKTECYTMNLDQPPPRPKPGEAPAPWCGMGRRTRDGIEVHGSTMADFCLSLSNMPLRLDIRKFVDKTGIAGRFDFDLKFSGDPGIPTEPGAAPVPPDDLTLLREALGRVGLRLTAAQGTDEVVVIDHAERPSAD